MRDRRHRPKKKSRDLRVVGGLLLAVGAVLLWLFLHWLLPWTRPDPWGTTEAFLIVVAVITAIVLLVRRIRPRTDALDI